MAIGHTLKYAARHLVKEPPLVQRRALWLQRQERMSIDELQAQQETLLRRTLLCAAQRLPAYAHLRGEIPRRDLHDFVRTLPVIDKHTLLAERSRYYPNDGRCRPWHAVGKTSGTTGTPLEVFRSYDSTLWEQACCVQHWRWAGLQAGERQAVLRGDMVTPVDRSSPPYWVEDRLGRQLIVSTRHLLPQHVADIVSALQGYGAAQLRAYPSAAHTLATLVHEAGLQLRFRSVVTSSEILLPVQRELIEATFSAKVFDHYGMAERVAFAMECEHGRLHVHPLYSHVEVLDELGQPTDDAGSVVGTTYHNLAMPLVRYRLSDRARWRTDPCPCGRTYPGLELLGGKIEDQLYDTDGQPVSPSVVTFAFKGVPCIAKAQVAQVGRGRWVVRVVPQDGFSAAHSSLLLHNFRTLVSPRVEATVDLQNDIPLLASGKYKWVSQEFYRAGEAPRAALDH
ncbi:phenylacetate--CoA ligase family protein [Ideonella sp. BN130291]|uniref:phenylacetate--CoA ligase family protein n=1 Tax=Ideonella sp. BN130291 TaxID=3112940 RepID=UPI002E2736FA|nr:hypothetical protein [Ideonella sp. BN130291]